MTLLACPDCGGNLGRNAEKCRCGWKRASVLPKLRVDCAHEGCTVGALIREQTPTGWANFCEYHWVQYHTEKARLGCEERGLKTKEDKIEFCRSMAEKMTRRWRTV